MAQDFTARLHDTKQGVRNPARFVLHSRIYQFLTKFCVFSENVRNPTWFVLHILIYHFVMES